MKHRGARGDVEFYLVVEDHPRPADDRRAPDHAGGDGDHEVDMVPIGRAPELFLRFVAVLVVVDECGVVRVCLEGEHTGTNLEEHASAGDGTSRRNLLLGWRCGHRRKRHGHNWRSDDSSTGEDLPSGVVRPTVVEIHSSRERQLEEWRSRPQTNHEVAHRDGSAVARLHGFRERGHEAVRGFLSFRSAADCESGHSGITPVVGGRAEVGLRRIQDGDCRRAERLQVFHDVREHNRFGAPERFVVRVAALRVPFIEEQHLAELGTVERDANVVELLHELRGRRVLHRDDRGVVPFPERMFRRLEGRGMRTARHDDGQHRQFGVAAERRGDDRVRLNAVVGEGGEDGEDDEDERSEHGFRSLLEVVIRHDFP